MPGDDRRQRAAPASVAGSPRDEGHPTRSFDTADLFGTDTEIEITHQQAVYRLKITRQGKLILNK